MKDIIITEQEKPTGSDYLRFTILSLIGIFLFFIPVNGPASPIVVAITWVRNILGDYLPIIVIATIVLLNISLILGRIFKIPVFQKYHQNDGPFRVGFFISALVIIILVSLNVNIAPIQSPDVGGRLLKIASIVITTIVVAGWGVVFMLKSGIINFVGTLIEPLMRPIFKLPGEAAVDSMASFVSSASVGVYFTDLNYKNKVYTQREAMTTSLNFSVVSLGFMAILCSYNHIETYYGALIICAFILTLFIAAITCRIPPASQKKMVYVDEEVQTEEQRQFEKLPFSARWNKAVSSAAIASREFTVKEFFMALVNALSFAQKIIAVQIPVVLLVLTLVYFTPTFDIIGKPMAPILSLLGLPYAAEMAPSILIGFIEITLPSILVTGYELPAVCGFFIALLSCCQIVFMTEAGNAMLSSSMPFKFTDLLFTFLIRTAIALPLCAFIARIIAG